MEDWLQCQISPLVKYHQNQKYPYHCQSKMNIEQLIIATPHPCTYQSFQGRVWLLRTLSIKTSPTLRQPIYWPHIKTPYLLAPHSDNLFTGPTWRQPIYCPTWRQPIYWPHIKDNLFTGPTLKTTYLLAPHEDNLFTGPTLKTTYWLAPH